MRWKHQKRGAAMLFGAAVALLILPRTVLAQDDDDDFDSGPVDKSVHISGAIQASYRATFFGNDNSLPDGSALEDQNNFQIEHTHLKFSGDLSDKLSWEVMPCVTHMDQFSVITANVNYAVVPAFQITFGRFLLPFGQFNVRSIPGQYTTISRPLLYQSHEDRTINVPGATPGNFLFTPRDDTGLLLSGSIWLGPDDVIQLSYSAFITNGLRGSSDTMARYWDDNNNGKQYGGRLSAGYNGDVFNATVGGSYLRNKYEETLDQQAWGVDAYFSYRYSGTRRINLRGEYVRMDREIQPTAELLSGDETLRGAYVTVDADLLDWLGVFAQWDTITSVTPKAQLNEKFRDLELTTNRYVGGFRFTVDGVWTIRVEYGRWDEPLGVPDANRISAQSIIEF